MEDFPLCLEMLAVQMVFLSGEKERGEPVLSFLNFSIPMKVLTGTMCHSEFLSKVTSSR